MYKMQHFYHEMSKIQYTYVVYFVEMCILIVRNVFYNIQMLRNPNIKESFREQRKQGRYIT